MTTARADVAGRGRQIIDELLPKFRFFETKDVLLRHTFRAERQEVWMWTRSKIAGARPVPMSMTTARAGVQGG
jgi:hypothetical protein